MPGAARGWRRGRKCWGSPGLRGKLLSPRPRVAKGGQGSRPGLNPCCSPAGDLGPREPAERAWGLGHRPQHPRRGGLSCASSPHHPLCSSLPAAYLREVCGQECAWLLGPCHRYMECLCPLGLPCQGRRGRPGGELGAPTTTPSPSLLGMLPPGPDGSSVGWPGDSVSHIDTPPFI